MNYRVFLCKFWHYSCQFSCNSWKNHSYEDTCIAKEINYFPPAPPPISQIFHSGMPLLCCITELTLMDGVPFARIVSEVSRGKGLSSDAARARPKVGKEAVLYLISVATLASPLLQLPKNTSLIRRDCSLFLLFFNNPVISKLTLSQWVLKHQHVGIW